MSRSDREQREAEREARRARRLAERAEQRAKRKAEQARQASERASELATRARRRRSPRDRNVDRSIEDFVDEVTEKISRKAEAWMDEQSQKLFEDSSQDADLNGSNELDAEMDALLDEETGAGLGSDKEARRAREVAVEARRRADQAEARARKMKRDPARRRRLRGARFEDASASLDRAVSGWGKRRRRRRSGNLYRSTSNRKVKGVCAGIADYWGVEAWKVRCMAIAGLFFIPSVTIPAYFIAYFLMDDEPYYRKVTDRFHELDEKQLSKSASAGKRRPGAGSTRPELTNARALKQLKQRFAEIEVKLRLMESHVTSPKFELQQELKKIAGE